MHHPRQCHLMQPPSHRQMMSEPTRFLPCLEESKRVKPSTYPLPESFLCRLRETMKTRPKVVRWRIYQGQLDRIRRDRFLLWMWPIIRFHSVNRHRLQYRRLNYSQTPHYRRQQRRLQTPRFPEMLTQIAHFAPLEP